MSSKSTLLHSLLRFSARLESSDSSLRSPHVQFFEHVELFSAPLWFETGSSALPEKASDAVCGPHHAVFR